MNIQFWLQLLFSMRDPMMCGSLCLKLQPLLLLLLLVLLLLNH